MTRPLLIVRPEPGAAATAGRARNLGLAAIVAPLFTVRSVPWAAPPLIAGDAVLLTSANALRHGGDAIASLIHLPAFTVGAATAAAARRAGFTRIEQGSGDAAAIVAQAAAAGFARLIHLAGREHKAVDQPGVTIIPRIVYAAEAATQLPDLAMAALAGGAVTLLHSPRAAALFRHLIDGRRLNAAQLRVAAISPAALAAAGHGWNAAGSAPTPDDAALLAVARRLCD